jgi:hypothetical protein
MLLSSRADMKQNTYPFGKQDNPLYCWNSTIHKGLNAKALAQPGRSIPELTRQHFTHIMCIGVRNEEYYPRSG